MDYVGLDIHKAFTYGVIKDKEGNKLRSEKFCNTEAEFGNFLEGFPPETTDIVMESTGVWEFIYDILDKKGYKAKLANTMKTKAIAWARVKTDAVDASTLADLLRVNLIPECYIPAKEHRKLREIIRQRRIIVRGKTQTINKIRAIMTRHGITIPYETICIKAIDILKQELDIKDAIVSHLNILEAYNNELEFIEKYLSEIIKKNEDAKILMTIPGIGEIFAMEFIGEVADINRFHNASALCSYAGLVPGMRQSGNTIKVGRLIKQSNLTLKNIAIQAAWTSVRLKEPNPINLYFTHLSKTKGRQKAICAAARKLICIMYAMLKHKEAFRA